MGRVGQWPLAIFGFIDHSHQWALHTSRPARQTQQSTAQPAPHSKKTFKSPMLTIEARWEGQPACFGSPYICAIGDTVTGGECWVCCSCGAGGLLGRLAVQQPCGMRLRDSAKQHVPFVTAPPCVLQERRARKVRWSTWSTQTPW